MNKTILKLKLSDIKPNPNNPRIIKDDKFKKLVQSLKDFPIMAKKLRKVVIDEDGVILGGNMRFKAIKAAGMKEVHVEYFTREDAEENNRLAKELDTEHVDKTYEEQCREFVIKDNVSGGEWDWDLIANEWDAEELEAWGLDTPDGWGEDTEVEEDDAPEVSDEPPVSKLGEVYQLGRHRVMCGSATDLDDADILLGDTSIDLYLTDPPYNVNYEGGTGLKIMNDSMSDGNFAQFLIDCYTQASIHMKTGAPFYIFHADSEGYNFRGSLKATDLTLKQCLIWVKNTMVLGRQDYQWQHEPILYGWKEGSAHKWYGKFDKKTVIDFEKKLEDLQGDELLELVEDLRKQSSVIREDKPARNSEHPTMKPLKLVTRLIMNSSKNGNIVFDNFLGSGSTLIACERTGRTCYGMELDPKYVDVIRKRYAKFINDNQLPDNWEELTAPIGEKND